MDLVTKTAVFPNKGETILGEDFFTSFGGKGANQAIASARLGADVKMFGCVGADDHGSRLLENLKTNGVRTDFVTIIPDVPSGVAAITISEDDNSIIVVPGANSEMKPELIEKYRDALVESDVILASIEIPLDTIRITADIANQHNIPFILNPAPAVRLSDDLLKKCTLITPNEHELAVSLGKENEDIHYENLIKAYHGQIVVTRGSAGATLKDSTGRLKHIPGHKVQVVDTTGAGDAFNGAVAYMLAMGKDLEEAIKFAMAVGALSVTKQGAQNGLPYLAECELFIRNMEEKVQ